MKATLAGSTPRIETKPSKQDGVINYDIDNKYPQRIVDIINASGTATLCTDMMHKFIFGEGFNDPVLAKLKVNSKITANQLLKKNALSLAKFNGVAFHVNYNALFEITSVNPVPFEDVRFTTPDHKTNPNVIALYDDWARIKQSKVDPKKIDFINFYNPNPEKIQAEVEASGGWASYKGQILFWSVDGIEYPLAPSDSVLEDVQTDSQSKLFKFRNITSNFMASHILESEAFESDEERENFAEVINDFQGADDASKILVLEKKAGQLEAGFDLKKVEIQDVDKLYEYTESSVRDNILRNYLIPPVLLIAQAGKLGSSSELKDSTALYNGQTADYRIVLSEIYEELLKGFKGTNIEDYSIKLRQADTVKPKDTIEGKSKIIETISNTSLSDKQKLNVLVDVYELTSEEAMKLLPPINVELDEEVVDEEAKAKANLRGSVGGVQGILQIQQGVSAGTTTREGAIAILEIIFGLSEADANRVLGEPQKMVVQ